MKKTFTAPDFGKITNIEFEGSAYLRGGIAEGTLTYTIGKEDHNVWGEFFVNKDGYLVHDVAMPDGSEVEIKIYVIEQ